MRRLVKLSLGTVGAVALGGVLGSFATSGMVVPTPVVPYTRPHADTPLPGEPYSYPVSASQQSSGENAALTIPDCAGIEGLDQKCNPVKVREPRPSRTRAVTHRPPPALPTASMTFEPLPSIRLATEPRAGTHKRDSQSGANVIHRLD